MTTGDWPIVVLQSILHQRWLNSLATTKPLMYGTWVYFSSSCLQAAHLSKEVHKTNSSVIFLRLRLSGPRDSQVSPKIWSPNFWRLIQNSVSQSTKSWTTLSFRIFHNSDQFKCWLSTVKLTSWWMTMSIKMIIKLLVNLVWPTRLKQMKKIWDRVSLTKSLLKWRN